MPSGDTTTFINMHAASVPTDKTLEANMLSFMHTLCASVCYTFILSKVTFHI